MLCSARGGMASVVLSDAEKLYIIHGVQVVAVLLYCYVKVAFHLY